MSALTHAAARLTEALADVGAAILAPFEALARRLSPTPTPKPERFVAARDLAVGYYRLGVWDRDRLRFAGFGNAPDSVRHVLGDMRDGNSEHYLTGLVWDDRTVSAVEEVTL